jgi:hypothetical protein
VNIDHNNTDNDETDLESDKTDLDSDETDLDCDETNINDPTHFPKLMLKYFKNYYPW